MSPLGGVVGIMVASFAARAATVSLTISRAVSLCCSRQLRDLLIRSCHRASVLDVCRQDGLHNAYPATLS